MLGWLLGRRRAEGRAADVRARLAAAFAHHQEGRFDQAQGGYEAVLEAAPGNFDAEHMLGVLALQRARPDEALGHLQRAVGISPGNAGAHNSLSESYRRLGRLEEAHDSLRQSLRLDPQLTAAHYNLAGLLRQLKRNGEAVDAYRRVLELDPGMADAHAGLGAALREAGEIDGALASCQRAAALNPASATFRLNVGNLLREKGFLGEAAAAYRAALELEPRFAEVHNNLGNILKHQGDTAAALACYEQALEARPDFAEALLNAAQLLRENRRFAEAEKSYRVLLGMRPDLAEAHFDLGNTLKGAGRTREALACYAKALELDPEYAEARWALAMSQLLMVAQDEAEGAASVAAFDADLAALERWCDAHGPEKSARAVGTQQPFYLAYHDEDHRERMVRYGSLCTRLMSTWQAATGLPMPARITRAQIRVGFVSAHVHDHSVWNALVKGWLQHLDGARFELRLFHLGNANDVETALAKSMVAHYTYGRSDIVDWTQQILAQQLDVLIYPEIGMDPLTAKLASLRLAPVQAASWGHPHTSGLPTIDYFLSADALEPERAERHYSERLVRLPGLGCCYTPRKVVAAEPDLAVWGLRESMPLLLCPGTPFKYAPRHDTVLVEIARRLGECQFVFFLPEPPELMARVRTRMERAFVAARLDPAAHLVFVPWQNRSSFYGLMARADVFLDTLGFSGFNTAMQAIECELPLVAFEGRFMRGRLASGILRSMRMDDLVAATPQQFVEIAVKLARDATYWGGAQARLVEARAGLYGDQAPVRALERFFEDAVRR
jgi:predicted O-linked N-acetylglucosamine transferase (SPINDLY family)